jgi:hypothetical protein
MLFEYMEQCQRFIRDQKQTFIDTGNLQNYVNRARREVAMRAQCVRVLTPISGAVISCSLTSGGSNYSAAATATITAPDFPSGFAPNPTGAQATATPIIQNGVITAVDIAYGGAGYYQPVISFTDTTGSGAAGTLAVSPISVMNQGQEVYPFSGVDLSQFPGAESVYAVISVAVLYANWRYTLAVPSFSSYQASLRSFPFQYQYVPFYCAQYGRGTSGNFFLYPQPGGPYQMEWDCLVLPSDLTDDQSVEILPEPFTDAVPFLGAYYAMLELQNGNAARMYKAEFDEWMHRYASYTLPGRASNPYGKPFW